MKDHEYVNFSEDYELNHHLKKLNKRQTEENRNKLRSLGSELKTQESKPRLKHGELHSYASRKSSKLD